MVDTLWAFGQRLKIKGISNPFENIPQAIEGEDLQSISDLISEAGRQISENGTPAGIPPIITCFLGKGKTSFGAQQIYNLLPVEEIKSDRLEEIFHHGSRHKVYKLILSINETYRLKAGEGIDPDNYQRLNKKEKRQHYLIYPEFYESNLDVIDSPYFYPDELYSVGT